MRKFEQKITINYLKAFIEQARAEKDNTKDPLLKELIDFKIKELNYTIDTIYNSPIPTKSC